MRELYLIRHGLAAERGTYVNDDERPLTEAGSQRTRQVAKRLKQLGLRFDYLLSSPLVRAQQTAELLQAAGLAPAITITTVLAPGGSLPTWIADYGDRPWRRLALVGHEPDLGSWAEQLVWSCQSGQLILKKAGVIGLEVPETPITLGSARLFWLTPPRLLL
jgi:phosphohistidine phosphatase